MTDSLRPTLADTLDKLWRVKAFAESRLHHGYSSMSNMEPAEFVEKWTLIRDAATEARRELCEDSVSLSEFVRVARGVPVGREADAPGLTAKEIQAVIGTHRIVTSSIRRAQHGERYSVDVCACLEEFLDDNAHRAHVAAAIVAARVPVGVREEPPTAGGRPAEPHPPIPNGAEPARLATAGQAEPAPLSVNPSSLVDDSTAALGAVAQGDGDPG